MANSAMAKKPFKTNSAKTTMISRINIFRGSPPLASGGPTGGSHGSPAGLLRTSADTSIRNPKCLA